MELTTRAAQVPSLLPMKLKDHVVIPCTQDPCECIKKICGRYGLQTHFKGNSTIKNLLVSPKDKVPMVNEDGAIYWFLYGDLICNDEYIGKTPRILGDSFRKHLKEPSPIHHHSNKTGHLTTNIKFQVIGREGHSLARNIKESIFIRVNNCTLNRNIGKFNLPHIWDRVLLSTPGLTLKRHVQAVGHANSNQPNTTTQLNQPTHLGQPNSHAIFHRLWACL